MKIGVLADTHDRLPTFHRAVQLFRRMKVDAILHAGDFIAPFAAKIISPEEISVPVHCVYGNNDGEREGLKKMLPQVVDGPLSVEIGGRRIVMHHFIEWLKPEDITGADLVITGHTHEVVERVEHGITFLNPGECCGWLTDRCTVAMVDLETMKVDIIEVHG